MLDPRQEFPIPPEVLSSAAEAAMGPLRLLQRYHRHTVIGAERVPTDGPALIVTNHSLATYDGFLLALALYEFNGRAPTGLADDLLFELPLLRPLALGLGMLPASPANGERLLRAGRLVYLAPGGMREALRSRSERYELRWAQRKGFVRLSVRTGAPIVLAACPAADDMYTVYESSLTKSVYEQLKLPLPLFRGIGPTLMPRRIRLTHLLSEPMHPPRWDPDRGEQQVDEWHERLSTAMAELMQQGRDDSQGNRGRAV